MDGIGVMIGYLGGNQETVNSINKSIGKKIKTVKLTADDKLFFEFEDDSKLTIFDDGQSCCESRYMKTDDNLDDFSGAIIEGFELKEAPEIKDEYGEHEVQFLDVKTDKGIFQMASHNEHNGYYGGFWIVAKYEENESGEK